jgi:cysteine desulfurase/selenocysteine lyase
MSETATNIQSFNVYEIRKHFPVLDQQIHGKPLIYFDNAATSHKPNSVINGLKSYYEGYNANIHRGIHTLAEKATEAYENTRKKVADYINAPESEEIIFTRGTTEGINLIAHSFGQTFLKEGDEILISEMEHHSNIVPWQIVAEKTGALLKVISIKDDGSLDLEDLSRKLSEKTKILSITYISNTLGTINPVKEIISKAQEYGAVTMIDGAQASPHVRLDVQDLKCDFLAFSSHKMYGPTGVGVLYGKRKWLEKMPPYQGGGEMIRDVSFEKTTYNDIPHKFEAGTPNIADVIGLQYALEFIEEIGIHKIAAHEHELLGFGTQLLEEIEGYTPIGYADNKASVISFNIEGIHPFDLGVLLDTRGIAIRTGHHCTQPLMNRFQIEGTARASFAVYNTKDEISEFVSSLKQIVNKLR